MLMIICVKFTVRDLFNPLPTNLISGYSKQFKIFKVCQVFSKEGNISSSNVLLAVLCYVLKSKYPIFFMSCCVPRHILASNFVEKGTLETREKSSILLSIWSDKFKYIFSTLQETFCLNCESLTFP